MSSLPSIKPIAFTKWPDDSCFNPHEMQAVIGWHCVTASGSWDVDRLCAELNDRLVASHQSGRASIDSPGIPRWQYLIFAKDSELLIGYMPYTSEFGRLRVWARDPRKAAEEFACLRATCWRDITEKTEAHFHVLTVKMGEVDSRVVRTAPTVLSSEDLSLHYGSDFKDWHDSFVAELSRRPHGLTILQGSPGTGKTTYLRHLLYQLRKTHRFYYLPLPVYEFLSSPGCVDFWIDQNEDHEHLTKVVVLEDAEALLAERHPDNQQSLSTLLNIGDGFLGDFLRVHVICTINTPVARLDPAVKRSGRLIAARKFTRLTWPQAQRLAKARELALEVRESYSLAEIYASSNLTGDLVQDQNPKVGFAA